jgi:fluoride exporter
MKDLSWRKFAAVGVGGILGCWLRYVLSAVLNPLFPDLPLGTLASNLIAAFFIGCMLGIFRHFEKLPAELRLFTTTGVLGGLSTYSTFSAEAVNVLLAGRYGWFAIHVLSHLIGSFAATLLGIYLMNVLFNRRPWEIDNPKSEK